MKNIINSKQNTFINHVVTTSLILFIVSIALLIFAPTIKVSALTSLINSTAQNMASSSDCGTSCQSSTTSTSSSTSSSGSLINQINTAAINIASDPTCSGSTCGQTTTTSGSSTTTTTTSTPPRHNPGFPVLTSTCNVSRTRIEEGESVRFDANVTGGRGPYAINWYGDTNRISGFNRTSTSQTVQINNSGTYYIDLEVTDADGTRSYDTCPVVIVDEYIQQRNLVVHCDLSRSTISVGERLDVAAIVTGQTSIEYFDWSGDARFISGFNLTRQSQTIRINESGTYRFRIDVEDRHGNTGTDTCTVRVIGGTLARDINVYSGAGTPPTGEFAGLSSVYLNQIPYTGTEEVVKVAGFISFVLIWSAAIAYYFLKDKKKKGISKKINGFKELNKSRALVD